MICVRNQFINEYNDGDHLVSIGSSFHILYYFSKIQSAKMHGFTLRYMLQKTIHCASIVSIAHGLYEIARLFTYTINYHVYNYHLEKNYLVLCMYEEV